MAVPGYDKLGDACLMFFSNQRCLFQCLVSDLLGKCIPRLDSFTVVLCGSGVFFLCYHSSVCRLCNFSLFHCLVSDLLGKCIPSLDSFTVVLCGSGVFFLCYHSSVCRLCNFSLFHCLLSNGLSLRISLLDGIFFVGSSGIQGSSGLYLLVSSCSAVGGLKDSALLGLSFGGLDLLLFGDLLLLAS